ncbi:hypothetical protein [Desulforhopalus singaporensis]|nr:hypothetical protein [Desulforhopalus singaporensis]
MNVFEKIYSVFAICFAAILILALAVYPELRYANRLITLCSVGFVINVGLMFIVLRDIFYRPFSPISRKYLWLTLVLLIWPTIIYYLPRYGFKPRC